MKKLLATLLLCFFTGLAYSQSISDFFKMLPDSAVQGFSKSNRAKLLQDYANNKSAKVNEYYFEIVDAKNGYIRLRGAFEGKIDVCYWNLSNGTKMIAVYEEACGPACAALHLWFYIYDGKTLSRKASNLVLPSVENAFYKEDPEKTKKEMDKNDVIATVCYDLPRLGKNITVRFGNEASKADYLGYLDGNFMTLTFNDGKFSKGAVVWNE